MVFRGKGIVMIAILILILLLGLLCYALVVASATADKDAHEAYMRWKEKRERHGKSIR